MKKEVEIKVGKNLSMFLKTNIGEINFTVPLLREILEVKNGEEFRLILEKVEKK